MFFLMAYLARHQHERNLSLGNDGGYVSGFLVKLNGYITNAQRWPAEECKESYETINAIGHNTHRVRIVASTPLR